MPFELTTNMDLLKQPLDSLRDDLDLLNKEWRDIEGSKLSANQCYHFETDPPHFLFNLNCPDTLRQKLQSLLSKHFPEYENPIL
jgi:hypothetical protein